MMASHDFSIIKSPRKFDCLESKGDLVP